MAGQEVTRFIDVQHDCADGWHTFTSDHIPGLFLTAHESNLEAAFHDIPRAIESLIRHDYGQEVEVRPQMTYDAYLLTLPASHRPQQRHYYAIEERRAA